MANYETIVKMCLLVNAKKETLVYETFICGFSEKHTEHFLEMVVPATALKCSCSYVVFNSY